MVVRAEPPCPGKVSLALEILRTQSKLVVAVRRAVRLAPLARSTWSSAQGEFGCLEERGAGSTLSWLWLCALARAVPAANYPKA